MNVKEIFPALVCHDQNAPTTATAPIAGNVDRASNADNAGKAVDSTDRINLVDNTVQQHSSASFVSSMNQTISVSFSSFYNDLSQVVTISDISVGIIKSLFFAVTISIVSCSVGLLASGGPREMKFCN